MTWRPMDYTEHDVERLLKENEREVARLAEAAEGLRDIVGKGESRSGLATAVVDADGRLRSVTLSPRVLRMDVAALAEEVVQAVRQAQDDQDRQARELLAVPAGQQLGLEEIQRQFAEFQETFAAETAGRNERLRRLGERDPRDD
ncbi:YbaB/EbfC family nucleoid-associated protein [Nonomuraea zeae]|uniref:YbaB/EbfC family nucleoid-associated protein n=1 Tax=Nonomuraea zeae TaxID=1642303 RepID=A0A5S4G267_9ACTN|nr:YbaB/EbfC family nucleoid-associated protein [Nonomuraea zeae]TMR27083.1 YbaB/EbfC family nucleoid-associated protein [Nonomuraea zeae]